MNMFSLELINLSNYNTILTTEKVGANIYREIQVIERMSLD